MAGPIHLKALEFTDPEEGPSRVTASFPADLLYSLAAFHGVLPSHVLTPGAAQHSGEFYGFVTGYVANRFYDDGVNEAAPSYQVFSGAHTLASFPAGSKKDSAPQQRLARALDEALSDLIGGSEEKQVERAQLAAMLSQTVINHGWREVTPIGRAPSV